MKKSLLLAALVAGSVTGAMATTATVNLSNFAPTDANGIPTGPIYYLAPGTLASGDVWVEVWGGADASSLAPLAAAFKASSFDVTGDGKDDMYLFEAGIGEFPAAIAGGSDVTLKVRAWSGATAYADAQFAGETGTWTLKSGSWDKTAQPLPLAPDIALNMPALTMIDTSTVIPEPTTIALALIGGAALFLRRRQ